MYFAFEAKVWRGIRRLRVRAGQTRCIRQPLQRLGPVNVAITFMMGTVSGSK